MKKEAKPDWWNRFLAGDLPYATLSKEDGKELAELWKTKPEHVLYILDHEIEIHEMCDNYIKAGYLREASKVLNARKPSHRKELE